MKIELNTPEDYAFLQSPTAFKVRKLLNQQMSAQVNALISAAVESSDPKVRGIATSFVTFKQTLELLGLPKEEPKDE